MAVTQNSYTGDGSTRNFSFSFPYLNQSHVKVKVDGVETSAFTFANASTLTLSTAPANGASVLIFRETPSSELLAEYTPGTALRESDLETSLNQILFVSQETQTLAENQSAIGLQEQIDNVNATALSAQATATNAESLADAALANPGGYINKIINGEFAVANRANGTATTGWILDRWYADIIGSACLFTRTAAFVSDPVESGLPSGVRQYMRVNVSSVPGSGNFVRMRQPIEGVQTLSGRPANISFWARVASGTAQVSASLTQRFGTGGNPSAGVEIAGAKLNLTTTWQRFSFTVTVPSIVGKTLGTNNDSALDLNVWFDAGSNFNTQTAALGQANKIVDITRLQVTQGETVCDWENRSVAEELNFCLRYWEQSEIFVQAYSLASVPVAGTIPYKVLKARTPLVTLPSSSNSGLSTSSVTGSTIGLTYTLTKNASAGMLQYQATVNSGADLIS